jgi:ParB-like nuclease family protein
VTGTQQQLALDDIRTDPRTQVRHGLNDDALAEYMEAIKRGVTLPPIDVFRDGEQYLVVDGYHRLAAFRHLRANLPRRLRANGAPTAYDRIDAEVHDGNIRDAILFACAANGTHGLPRTNADKGRAVSYLLEDGEWKLWSDNEIARRCGVSQPFVSKTRKVLEQRQARWVGTVIHRPTDPSADSQVSVIAVEAVAGAVESATTDPGRDTVRIVRRGGTEYPMRTANIGRVVQPLVDDDDSRATVDENGAADEQELAVVDQRSEPSVTWTPSSQQPNALSAMDVLRLRRHTPNTAEMTTADVAALCRGTGIQQTIRSLKRAEATLASVRRELEQREDAA